MSRILVIEDEPILARNVARALGQGGFEVTQALSAEAAARALEKERYDLVLADISLGDGDGIEVVGRFRSRLSDTPIVIMTGQDSVKNRLRADEITVSAFLAKPFALSRLRELVNALTANDTARPATQTRGPSVVMYSHDTIGLGHMRRNSAIARELVARIPGLSVLMLVGCPVGMVFDPHPGIDYVKLPSMAKLGRGVFQPGTLRFDADTTRALRMGIIERVLDTIRPDLFLIDHEPTGVSDELLPVLETIRAQGSTQVLLGLRDILDDPERVDAVWRASGTDRVIADLYDGVIVYGSPNYFPSIAAYGLDRLKPGAVHYCGIVTSACPNAVRRVRGRPQSVVVAGGGGRDAYPLIEAALLAYRLLPSRRRPALTVVTGPLMDAELQDVAQRLADSAGATCIQNVADFPGLLAKTDLFISMAGYNSVNESLALGCPLVAVPRVGPSSEQRLRATALESLGLARVLWREELTPKSLARIMTARLPDARPTYTPDFNGAANAASLIAAQLDRSGGSNKTSKGKEQYHVLSG